MKSLFRRGAWLLVTTMALSLVATAARADIGSPWFQLNANAPDTTVSALQLATRYVSFWCYTDGLAWAQFNQVRMAQAEVPAIYLARPATPLPSLAAAPAHGPAPVPAPVPVPVAKAEPAPALVTKPVQPDRPVPQPEPAPAPVVKPEPAPAPVPVPVPVPVTVQPDQPATPAPAPAPAPVKGLTDEEQQMVDLVNAARTSAGLPSLTVDLRLVQTARAKSQDMVTGGYFDHTSPTLGSPFQQMAAAGISYRAAGENIAGNQSVAAAQQALLNSPGHRANILSEQYTKVGIGIVHGGPYGLMVTQQFIGD